MFARTKLTKQIASSQNVYWRRNVKGAMDTKQRISARVTRQFSSSPQRVFDAWLDSTTAGQWLFATGQIICSFADQ
jgi:hypothetical protein